MKKCYKTLLWLCFIFVFALGVGNVKAADNDSDDVMILMIPPIITSPFVSRIRPLKSGEKIPPLFDAIEHKKDYAFFKKLLDDGADPNARAGLNATPLIFALENPDLTPSYEILKLLIERGADVNALGFRNQSPLKLAARNNNYHDPKITQLLLEHGADANVITKNGESVMYGASPKVFDLLLDAGIDINKPDQYGTTNFMWACSNGSAHTIKRMLELGADVHAKNSLGATPLLYAMDYDAEVVELLLKAGADVNAKDNEGDTPLIRASKLCKKPKVFDLFLKAGAKINAQNNDGMTALMNAAEYYCGDISNVEAIKYLLDKGANPNIKDNKGKTALDYASAPKESKNFYTDKIEECKKASDNSEAIKILKAAMEKAQAKKAKQKSK